MGGRGIHCSQTILRTCTCPTRCPTPCPAPCPAPCTTSCPTPCSTQHKLAQYNNYSHKCGGRGIHYVQNLSRPGTVAKLVNLANPSCCCYARDFKLPCRHVLVVFNAMKMMTPQKKSRTMQRFWAPQFMAKMYYDVHKQQRVILPVIRPGKFQGAASDKILTPPITNPRGRPKTKR